MRSQRRELNDQKTKDAASPGAKPPTIDIIFEGLFLLCFSAPDSSGIGAECQAGLIATALDHELLISVEETIPGPQPKLTQFNNYTMRIGRALLAIAGEIKFNFKVAKPGVTRKNYVPGKLDRSTPSVDPENFGWIIDLENNEMYGKHFDIVPGVVAPVLRFNAGEFYTNSITPDPYIKTVGGKIKSNFGHVAEVIGARLDLNAGEDLYIEIGGGNFRFSRAANATYVIRLSYVCPKFSNAADDELPQSSARFGPPPSGRSDLQYFYHALKGLPVPEWIELVPHGVQLGDPPLICYPTTGGQTVTLI
jgi:hypothetical protein